MSHAASLPRAAPRRRSALAIEEAYEEARNRLLVWRVASQIRLQRGVPEGEPVRVTLRDRDGAVLFAGEVR